MVPRFYNLGNKTSGSNREQDWELTTSSGTLGPCTLATSLLPTLCDGK